MTEDKNEMKNDWILESLVRNDPFVLPSLEELQRMNNEMWQDESKGYGSAFDNCIIQDLSSDQKNQVQKDIDNFKGKYGYSFPSEYQKISLIYNLNNISFGSGSHIRVPSEILKERLNLLEGLIEDWARVPDDLVEVGYEEGTYFLMNLEDGGIYAIDENDDADEDNVLLPSMKIADNFDLYFRGSVYGDIIFQNLVVLTKEKGNEVNISELKRLTEELCRAVGGEDIHRGYWDCLTGFYDFNENEG